MAENKSGVDDTLTAVSGEWEFDEDVADSFDSHVRKSVPFYDEVQRMVVELSEYFVREDSTVYDLGCSTGETLARLLDLHANKQTRFIGVELSESMAGQARSNVGSDRVRVLNQNVLDTSFSPSPDFVTALYTLQFLTLSERRELLEQLYEALNEGAALVFTEKVHSNDAQFEDMWLELFWDFKRRQGLSPDEILQKACSIRGVLKPLSNQENLNLLRQAGFERVTTFFQWYNWTGFIAVKNRSTDCDRSSDLKADREDRGSLSNHDPEDVNNE
ncbi:MAG: methyltransferase domain-containing protein [bacterium]